MASFKSFRGSLFHSATDRLWLNLLDSAYQYGIEIAARLGGSRSQGQRTQVYRGYYLNEAGARRASCVVKLGLTEAVERDYQGWLNFSRRQPDRDSFATTGPLLRADFGAALITDFVGSADLPPQSLAGAIETGFLLLEQSLYRLVEGTLAPLHESRRDGEGLIPSLRTNQGALLADWLAPGVVAAASKTINNDQSLRDWERPQFIDSTHKLALDNYLPDLLAGAGLPGGERSLCLPLGAVHGDPNFDNIFVAFKTDPPRLDGVALIDFEWCTAGSGDSPYADLARLECELLFGRSLLHHRELILGVALTEIWLADEEAPAIVGNSEKEVFSAITMLRARARDLAAASAFDADREEESFQRAYLVTLLGQAVRYLFYAGFEVIRSQCLFLCQLLAARLAKPGVTPFSVPFSTRLTPVLRDGARVEEELDSYLLCAAQPRAYASLTTPDPDPTTELLVSCDLALIEASESSWCALCIGVDPRAPERSGLAAMLRPTPTGQATIAIVSHRDSRHRSPPVTLQMPLDGRLLLKLNLRGSLYTFSASSPMDSSSLVTTSLTAPSESYRGGQLAAVAHKLDLRLHGFCVRLRITPAATRV